MKKKKPRNIGYRATTSYYIIYIVEFFSLSPLSVSFSVDFSLVSSYRVGEKYKHFIYYYYYYIFSGGSSGRSLSCADRPAGSAAAASAHNDTNRETFLPGYPGPDLSTVRPINNLCPVQLLYSYYNNDYDIQYESRVYGRDVRIAAT